METSLRYQNYAEYLEHQASKLALFKHSIIANEPRYRMELRKRLEESGLVSVGMSVLCLGARLGGEVRAFIDCGCFAIGLDLNPGEGNRFVVRGDFHQIQYGADSVDVVFTNSLDHVFDLFKFIDEICRVLKPGGLLIMDVVRGTAEGWRPDPWDCFFWEKVDDMLLPFMAAGFYLIHRDDFEWPWPGQHVILRRNERE